MAPTRLRRGLQALSLQALYLALICASKNAGAVSSEAPALLSLPAAVSNWDAATAALPGAAWSPGTDPCRPAWKGLTCSAGQASRLSLGGLGLAGTLPAELAGLAALSTLNLSGNAFVGTVPLAWMAHERFASLADADLGANQLSGGLPVELLVLATDSISIAGNEFESLQLPLEWSSTTLAQLDLSSNTLAGLLPVPWGTRLPALRRLGLTGNHVRGPIPSTWWLGGFADQGTVVDLRTSNGGASNEEVCGAVMPLDPAVYGGNSSQFVPTDDNRFHSGGSTTSMMLTQAGLFGPNTTVTMTNWLGPCLLACVDNTLPVIKTNLFDLSWAFRVAIPDVFRKNPWAAQLPPGAELTDAPCYSGGTRTVTGYWGGDAAFGMFAGGNQLAGMEGVAGAMAAARVVGSLPNRPDKSSSYEGSLAPGSKGVVEPVYWFVDLQAPLQVSTILLTAGGQMRNASVYVGSDTTSVQANKLVASGIDLQPGQQVAVAAGGAPGRFLVVYTGALSEGRMNLSDVQVYTFETNAAAFKPLTLFGGSTLSTDGNVAGTPGSGQLQAINDNNSSSCARVQPSAEPLSGAAGQTGLVAVDLGYTAPIAAVATLLGAASPANLTLSMHVLDRLEDPLTNDSACAPPVAAVPGAWAAVPCNKTGRYVALSSSSALSADLCAFQVGLAAPPAQPAEAEGGGGLSGGAIAGVVCACVAGTGALLALLSYCSWRRSYLRRQAAIDRRLQEAAKRQQAWLEGSLAQEGEASPPGLGSGGDGGMGTTGPSGTLGIRATGGGLGMRQSGHLSSALPSGYSSSSSIPVPSQGAGSGAGGRSSTGGSRRPGRSPSRSKVSELKMIEEWLQSLRKKSDSGSSKKESGDGTVSTQFGRDTNSSPVDVSRAATDVSLLPEGFASVLPSDITLVEQVGEGSFGTVWLAKFCQTSVAVKILSKAESTLNDLRTEATLMAKLRHPHVCLYFGACMDPPCLVMEYCSNRSLDIVLKSARADARLAKQLTWVRLLTFGLDAAKGMLYLHTRVPPVVHRDLKSANLLVDGTWHIKVADFNLSRSLGEGGVASTIILANPRWLAPEVLGGQPGQLPADVWAFGTMLWELLSWRLPFSDPSPLSGGAGGPNFYQIINLVQSTEADPLVVPPESELPAGPFPGYARYVDLLRACHARDPAARPTFDVVVRELSALLEEEVRRMAPESAGLATVSSAPLRSLHISTPGQAAHAYATMLRQRQASLVSSPASSSPGSGPGTAGHSFETGSGGAGSVEPVSPPPQLAVRAPFAGQAVRPSPFAGRGGAAGGGASPGAPPP